MAKDGRGYWAGIVAAAIGLAMLASSALGQEVPPAQVGSKAGVHQFGIIVREDRAGELSLNLPEFVHRGNRTRGGADRLDFSALYFLPPLMMQGPVTLDVRQTLDKATAWYPYSHETSSPKVRAWDKLLVGVQADGLETTHPVWMAPRRMETASTVKVYKPGPPGRKPDDEGTTEGEVYVFLRGAVADDGVFLAVGKTEALIRSRRAENKVEFTSATEHAWLAMTGADGEIRSLRITMPATGKELRVQHEGLAESHRPEQDDPSAQPQSVSGPKAHLIPAQHNALGIGASLNDRAESPAYNNHTLNLRAQLNEALVGNGLRGDEAAAQSDLILQLLADVKDEPVLVYLMPQEWVDRAVPLEVKGDADKPTRVFVTIRKATPVVKL